MTMLELGLIALIAASAFANAGTHDYAVLWRGLAPEFWSAGSLANALVVAIFVFWGWDVIFNLAEETAATERVSARAGFLAFALLTVIFVFFAALVAVTLTPSELEAGGGNAIFVLADKLLPEPLGYVAVLTFLLSVIGGIEASIVSFSRTLLANARDRRLPALFGRLHEGTQAPALAVLLGSAIVLVLLLVSAAFETIEEAINASISATGIVVAAYYAMAAVACAVFFRSKRETSLRLVALYVMWPLASAAIFVVAAVITLIEMNVLALGVLSIGMTLGLVMAHRKVMRCEPTSSG